MSKKWATNTDLAHDEQIAIEPYPHQTNVLSFFIGSISLSDDGSQSVLIFQSILSFFRVPAGLTKTIVVACQYKGLSRERKVLLLLRIIVFFQKWIGITQKWE